MRTKFHTNSFTVYRVYWVIWELCPRGQSPKIFHLFRNEEPSDAIGREMYPGELSGEMCGKIFRSEEFPLEFPKEMSKKVSRQMFEKNVWGKPCRRISGKNVYENVRISVQD